MCSGLALPVGMICRYPATTSQVCNLSPSSPHPPMRWPRSYQYLLAIRRLYPSRMWPLVTPEPHRRCPQKAPHLSQMAIVTHLSWSLCLFVRTPFTE